MINYRLTVIKHVLPSNRFLVEPLSARHRAQAVSAAWAFLLQSAVYSNHNYLCLICGRHTIYTEKKGPSPALFDAFLGTLKSLLRALKSIFLKN